MDAMSSNIQSVLINDLIHPMSTDEDCYIYEQFFFLYCWEEAEQPRIYKTSQKTSMFWGHMYVYELLSNPHPGTCYKVYHLKREIFFILCNTLKEGNYIKESKGVSVEEAVFIFLYIFCQKLGMSVTANRF